MDIVKVQRLAFPKRLAWDTKRNARELSERWVRYTFAPSLFVLETVQLFLQTALTMQTSWHERLDLQ